MSETIYCSRHPETPTNLRCSRCDKPVCPQCLVHAAVGIRCLDCGQATRLPTYNVSTSYLVKAILAALALGVGGGLVLAFVIRLMLFGFLYVAALAGFGYLMSEVISVATNRKKGRSLQFVAAGGILVAMVLTVGLSVTVVGGSVVPDLLGAALAIYVAVVRLR